MITAKFYKDGFLIKGHGTTDEDDEEGRLVCSAVSSAAIMAANTITEILEDTSIVTCEEGYLSVRNIKKESEVILKGLKLHITELSKKHKNRIIIS